MLEGKSILVTGGTGSFGHKFIEMALKKYPKIKRLIVYSRDEMKQYEMAKVFSPQKYPQMRYFIGDVRDRSRLSMACEDVDVIIHAAALKHVPMAEYNPMEAIKTNVFGAENVIEAARECGASKVVALSTDKAAAPINLYGATKLCSDKLFVAANALRGGRDLTFSVVRYGNVMGSRGSVIPFFMEQKSKGFLPITDKRMTRFNITLEQGVNLVFYALQNAWGGEIFVPKIPSYRILDVAQAVAPDLPVEYVGIRPGEKIHEEMITETDALSTLDCGNYFVILPTTGFWDENEFMKEFSAQRVPEGFRYNSGENKDWLSVDDLRTLIREHVNSQNKQ
jgi:UDP-N-acetylglucosamine 4,6-dehydratase